MTQQQFAQQFALGPVEKKYPIEPKQTEIDFSSFLQGDQGQQPAVEPALEAAAVAVQTASPQDLESVKTELSNNPQAVNDVLARASQEDATGGDGSNLSNFDKVAMGLMALLPILGNALGGKDGALTGLGAAAQGIGVGAQLQQQEDLLGLKVGANKKNADRTQERFNRQDKREDDKANKAVNLKLRDSWAKNKTRETFEKIRVSAENIINSAQRQGGIFDTAAIISFMKLLDPGSVVKESEQDIVEQASGKIESWKNLDKKLTTGARLTSKLKKEIRQVAGDISSVYAAGLTRKVKELRETARLQGLDPDSVVREDFVEREMAVIKAAIDAISNAETEDERRSSSRVKAKPEKGFFDSAVEAGERALESGKELGGEAFESGKEIFNDTLNFFKKQFEDDPKGNTPPQQEEPLFKRKFQKNPDGSIRGM